MAVLPHNPAPESGPTAGADHLASWKEIAAYLNRTIRTVHRWEKEEGLPVHRHHHKKLGSVYAYRSEIDQWWNDRQARLESDTGWTKLLDRLRPRAGVATAVLVAVVAALVAARYFNRDSRTDAHSPAGKLMLAVLPFENLSGDSQEYLGDGLTEELVTEIGRLQPEKLGVIARTSVMTYKHTRKGASEIGRELGVNYLVQGTLRRERNSLRITVQLIQVQGQTTIWAERYDREIGDLLALQDEVARDIASAIKLKLSPNERLARRSQRRVQPGAYEAYLKGRHFWSRRSQEGLRKAIEHFEQAIDADPSFAPAYAELADVHAMSAYYGITHQRAAAAAAREQANKALQLDDELAEAHMVLAQLNEHDWDWSAAEKGFLRAIDLSPNYARAYHLYGFFLERRGRVEEAKPVMRRALTLDPVSLIINKNAADPFYFSGEYDRAIEQYRKTLELDPDFVPARLFLGFCYEQQGLLSDAIAQFQRGASLDEDPKSLAALGHAYALSRNPREARKVLAELLKSESYVDPYHIAVIHVGLGENDDAFIWLESAFREKSPWLLWVKVDPRLEPLRDDSRYSDLLRRMTPST